MLELPRPESSGGVAQLEWPQKVACLLEVGPHSEDLMDQVLHTHDTVLSKVVLNNLVIGKGNSLLVYLAIATLVNELADSLEVGITVGDIGLDYFEHLNSSFRETNEDTIIDL